MGPCFVTIDITYKDYSCTYGKRFNTVYFFRRVLKNREKEVIIVPPEMGHPLEVSAQKKRESIHSIKNAIGKLLSHGINT